MTMLKPVAPKREESEMTTGMNQTEGGAKKEKMTLPLQNETEIKAGSDEEKVVVQAEGQGLMIASHRVTVAEKEVTGKEIETVMGAKIEIEKGIETATGIEKGEKIGTEIAVELETVETMMMGEVNDAIIGATEMEIRTATMTSGHALAKIVVIIGTMIEMIVPEIKTVLIMGTNTIKTLIGKKPTETAATKIEARRSDIEIAATEKEVRGIGAIEIEVKERETEIKKTEIATARIVIANEIANEIEIKIKIEIEIGSGTEGTWIVIASTTKPLTEIGSGTTREIGKL